MREIGGFFGWLIVIAYLMATSNYIIKFINNNYFSLFSKNEKIKRIFNWKLKVFVKYHRIFGILVLIFLLVHLFIQYSRFGINITGAIGTFLIVLQIALGIYGQYVSKKRLEIWFYIHRVVSVMLIFAIAIHIS